MRRNWPPLPPKLIQFSAFVTRLHLSLDGRFPDPELGGLCRQFPNLRELIRCPDQPEQLSSIGLLTKLESLHVAGRNTSGGYSIVKGSALNRLPHSLKDLSISTCLMTDEDLKAMELHRLPQLETFSFSGIPLRSGAPIPAGTFPTAAGWKYLPPTTKELNIQLAGSYTGIGKALEGLPKLKKLFLQGAGLTEGDLVGLPRTLQEVQLRAYSLVDLPIDFLELTELRAVTLIVESKMTEAVLAKIPTKKLQSLTLSGFPLTATGLQIIADMPALQKLDIKFRSSVKAEELFAALETGAKELRELVIPASLENRQQYAERYKKSHPEVTITIFPPTAA